MTFNSLRTACNQTSNRDPVVDFDQRQVEELVRGLRQRHLIRIVHTPGQRVLKCHQLLDEQLELSPDESALITVLLLRGPQTSGELKTRTERLHPFPDRAAVQESLQRLAARAQPLVHQLPRQPGQHDHRWQHLLGPAATPVPSPEPTVDREAVLAQGAAARDALVSRAYQHLVERAGREPQEPLAEFDRWLLSRVAAMAGSAPVVDVGCGTGRSTACLAARGAQVTGLDVVPAVVERAHCEQVVGCPGLQFEVGDLRALMRPRAASAWGAVVAWHSLGHFAPSELPTVIGGLSRVLAVGGVLAVAVGVGPQPQQSVDTPEGPIVLPVVEHDPAEVFAAVRTAGLRISEWYVVGSPATDGRAGPDIQRLALLAHRPR